MSSEGSSKVFDGCSGPDTVFCRLDKKVTSIGDEGDEDDWEEKGTKEGRKPAAEDDNADVLPMKGKYLTEESNHDGTRHQRWW